MITNELAIKGLQVINTILSSNEKHPTKFIYALIKNKQLLEPVLKAYNETIESDNNPIFDDLKSEWDRVSKDYALLDQSGNPFMKNDGSVAIDPNKAGDFNSACIAIVEAKPEWKSALANRTKIVTELQQADSKFVPFQVSIDSFPSEMNGTFLEALSFMFA